MNSWIFSHSINGKICFPAITPLKGVNVEHIRDNNGTLLFGAKVLPRYVTKVPWSYPNFLWFPSVFKKKEKQRALFSVTEEELLVSNYLYYISTKWWLVEAPISTLSPFWNGWNLKSGQLSKPSGQVICYIFKGKGSFSKKMNICRCSYAL